MRTLEELRAEIDAIDPQIVSLFERRMAVVEEVAAWKLAEGREVIDPAREQEKIAAVRDLATTPFRATGAEELFRQLMAISRKRQYQLIEEAEAASHEEGAHEDAPAGADGPILFQGVEGAYSHLAARRFFGADPALIPAENWRDVVDAVREGRAARGVLPIENSTAGSVTDIYDLLLESGVYLVGEIILPVDHVLMGLPGAGLDAIAEVRSHPQALAQCGAYLAQHPAWRREAVPNTALAAKLVAESGDPSLAAIASEDAAGYYGLAVLDRHLSTEQNSTRFVVIAAKPEFHSEARKISICFGLPHTCGSLYGMLSHFIFNDLNLTKIESRPVPEQPFQYRFFIDFEGNVRDPAVRNALRGIRAEAGEFTLLGNY